MLDRAFWWVVDRVVNVSYTARLPAQHGDHHDHQFSGGHGPLWVAERDGEPLEPFHHHDCEVVGYVHGDDLTDRP